MQGICAGVSRVLAMTHEQHVALGRKARALFEADRAAFEAHMREVRQLLRRLVDAAAAGEVHAHAGAGHTAGM
jgi:hypothetical protein